MFPLGSTQNQITIESLDVYESGTYSQQYRRSIDTTVDGSTLLKLQESTRDGTTLNSQMLSTVASQIVNPSMNVDGHSDIAGGWGEKKFRYVMVLNIVNTMGGFKNRKVLTGYTNHMGITAGMGDNSVHLDPNMMFFINSDLTLRDSTVPSPCGTRMMTRTERVNVDQVITGSYGFGRSSVDVSIRPEDILMNMSSGADVMAHGGGQVVDTYSQFVGSPVKLSARANASPSHYLFKILKSYSDAASYGDTSFAEDGFDDIMVSTANGVKDRSFTDDVFLTRLREVSEFMDNGYFTYRDLLQLFGEIDPIVSVHKYRSNGTVHMTPPQAGDSAAMDNSDATTMVMARISNSLPSMMFDSLLAAGGFVFTNDVPGAQPQITPIDPLMFGSIVKGMDVGECIRSFQARFLTELAPILTYQNQVRLTVKIVAHVFGNTELIINYDGTGDYKYNLPTFCDAVTSPMVTNQMGRINNIARDIHNVLDVLGGGASANTTLSPGTLRNQNNWPTPGQYAAQQSGGFQLPSSNNSGFKLF